MKHRYLLCLSALAGMVIGLGACTPGTNPVAGEPGGIEAAATTVRGVRLLRAGPSGLAAAGATAVRVGPTAGAVATLGSGVLSVPAGAVAEATTITMRSLPGIQGFVFGPSGLRFSTPATLTIGVDAGALRAAGVDPARLRIAGASDGADDWSVIGGSYERETETVTAPIRHFSRYALIID